MRKLLAFAWCALFGCSIAPDGSFESPPKTSLKKIVITANDDPTNALPVSTLTANVTQVGNKISMQFEGTLDPFWFVPKVSKIDYEFNDRKLLTEVVLTFQSGGIQTEQFAYNAAGSLTEATTEYTLGNGGTAHYDYKFFYNENALPDSIAKTVTITHNGTQTIRGFFTRLEEPYGYNSGMSSYYSVFPYTQPEDNSFVNIGGCGYFETDLHSNKASFKFSTDATNSYVEYSCVVNRDDQLRWESSAIGYFNSILPYVKQRKSLSYNSAYTLQECHPYLQQLSYYRLLPEMNVNYAILEMLNMAEERYWVNYEPDRLTKFQSLKVEYEYNYAD